MTSSNITKFEQTRNEIVRAAYENCRVAIDGEELTAEQMQKGVRELKSLLKFWQSQGFHMWKLGEAWLFAQKGKAKYLLGKNGDLASDKVKENQLTDTVYNGYNYILLDANKTLPEAGDKIALILCNNELFFSKVTAVDGNVVHLSDYLPCCSHCGAKVYFFSELMDRPLKILQARRCLLGGNEIEMVNLENAEYYRLPQKEQQGTPTSWTYVQTLDNGTFYLWNTPSGNNCIIKFTFEQSFDLMEDSKNTPDVAQEWIEPLTWELAYRLSAYCGLDLNEREWLKAQAKETLEQARIFDQETGGFQIVPDYRGF